MADVERSLVWKTISSGELHDVIGRGIEPDHFADPDCRDVFEFLIGFQRRHKQTPSSAVVKEEFPEFKPLLSKDPLSYHMERFVKKVREREAVEAVRGFHDVIEDPDLIDDVEVYALEMARRLAEVVPSPRIARYSEMDRRIEEYQRRVETGEIHGIYLGIPSVDNEMRGIQPHEILVVVAYMGVGKSILMGYMSYAAYLQAKSTLFVSLEMEAEAILRRLDVLATQVRFQAMKALELGVGDIEMWKKIAEQVDKDKHERDIMIVDDIRNCTPDKVEAQMLRYKPDLVCVDYLELMARSRGSGGGFSSTWESISDNGIALKQIARTQRIPIITAAQLNREGGKGEVTLANVSFQSIGKHSDVLLGLSQDEEQEIGREMDVVALKMRDGRKGIRANMRWNLDTMEIHEKGHAERFPERKKSGSLFSVERKKAKRLQIKQNVAGQANPFSARSKGKKLTASGWPVKKAA